jgi:spore maturation protein CgeB
MVISNNGKIKSQKIVFKKLKIQNDIYNQSYVKKIKKSKINLSFTSYDNLDEYPYRLLEIIMSNGFCLHQLKKNEKLNILKKNKEIITFDNVNELSNKIKYYLINKKEREKIIQV